MIKNEEPPEIIDEMIEKAKEKIVDRLSEFAIGGSCSYETSTPFIIELQKLDEISELKNARKEDLLGFDSKFWKNLNKVREEKTENCEILKKLRQILSHFDSQENLTIDSESHRIFSINWDSEHQKTWECPESDGSDIL